MMALPLPDLDDRRWDDLVEEGRALIPFHAPEWTDHNAHDPGITLLELFAWLTEIDIFILNQITDEQKVKLLRLAGIAPRPAQPARALLDLELKSGFAPLALAAGCELAGTDVAGETVRFRTTHDLTVHPGVLAALMSEDAGGFRNLTGAWKRGEPLRPFGSDPSPGSALLIGVAFGELDQPWTAGDAVSLGFIIDGAEQGSDETEHHGVRLVWELLTGNGWIKAPVRDRTRALSRSGRVELDLPDAPEIQPFGTVAWSLAWVRVRIARGRHDAAPLLRAIAFNGVEVEQAVSAVTRLRVAAGVAVPDEPGPIGDLIDVGFDLNAVGELTALAFNPVLPGHPAVRLLGWNTTTRIVTFEAAAIGRGSGAPSYEMTVPGDRLIASSVTLTSLEADTVREWAARPDFDASRRADAHFVVDAERGSIVTGDGERGRTAPAVARLLATGDVTRAEDGNLPAGAINSVAESPRNRALYGNLMVNQPFKTVRNVAPASGGAAAEPLPAAIARAREERERPLRAVTLDDHVALALETPGARIARAEARANFHPGFPCLTAPGIVTVLILPHLPDGRPEPTAGLRRRVKEWLDRRRVIGTRIEVAGPVYVPVAVRADVAARDGIATADLVAAITERLDRFFHPLHGGPAGAGWPFGRDVYRSEVLQVIDETPGVSHVRSLDLIDGDGEATCGNLCIGPLGLVDAGDHAIRISARSDE